MEEPDRNGPKRPKTAEMEDLLKSSGSVGVVTMVVVDGDVKIAVIGVGVPEYCDDVAVKISVACVRL